MKTGEKTVEEQLSPVEKRLRKMQSRLISGELLANFVRYTVNKWFGVR